MVGGLVLLLGIVRGTTLGPIDSVGDVFGTAYGLTWLVALLVTVTLFATGARLLGPAVVGLREASDVPAAVARVRRIAQVDLGALPRGLHLHGPDAVRTLGRVG